MKRATLYIVILGIVCVGLGVAFGIAIEKRYTRTHLPQIVRSHFLRHPGSAHLLRRRAGLSPEKRLRAGTEKIFNRIDRELGLSSEQRDEVKTILEDTKEEIKRAQKEFRTRVLGIREKGTVEISKILDPEQEERFQRMRAGMKEECGKRGRSLIK